MLRQKMPKLLRCRVYYVGNVDVHNVFTFWSTFYLFEQCGSRPRRRSSVPGYFRVKVKLDAKFTITFSREHKCKRRGGCESEMVHEAKGFSVSFFPHLNSFFRYFHNKAIYDNNFLRIRVYTNGLRWGNFWAISVCWLREWKLFLSANDENRKYTFFSRNTRVSVVGNCRSLHRTTLLSHGHTVRENLKNNAQPILKSSIDKLILQEYRRGLSKFERCGCHTRLLYSQWRSRFTAKGTSNENREHCRCGLHGGEECSLNRRKFSEFFLRKLWRD